jgi:hypothetical protein
MGRMFGCLHCIARPQQYKSEQWFALILGIVCLSVDLWAVYEATPSGRSQAWPFYSLEGALALSVVALMSFAFSEYPAKVP